MISLVVGKMAYSSLKTQTGVVLTTLVVVVSLPVSVVFATAGAGIEAASTALAVINPVTHLVDIRDPNGTVVANVQVTTTWPVRGKVTTEFGEPTPYQKHHSGTDIAYKTGEPITVFMDGSVIKVDDDPNNKTGYGKYVLVRHSNNVTSLYGHMEDTRAFFGQIVKPGDTIGFEGNTGHSTGTHLHFEVRVFDVPVNPRTFIMGNPAP